MYMEEGRTAPILVSTRDLNSGWYCLMLERISGLTKYIQVNIKCFKKPFPKSIESFH